jgi:hypothetical protein
LALAVPVLRTNRPLTLVTPEFAVWRARSPLENPALYPVVIATLPPDAYEEVPADNTISPPVPQSPDPTVI